MNIDAPRQEDIPALRRLWQQAFGDTDAFLNRFFAYGFAPERCRCLWQEGQLGAALYWFDCSCQNEKIAYLYAVATEKCLRGKGLCRALMEDTHRHLQRLGYAGSLLVPGSPELFSLYEKLGYETCSFVREFTCEAGAVPVPLRQVTAQEYAQIRHSLLPPNAVVQEGTALALLAAQGALYAGENCLLAALPGEQGLEVQELLGSPDLAPGILAALGQKTGRFRTPGDGKPFALYRSIRPEGPVPGWFGLALD